MSQTRSIATSSRAPIPAALRFTEDPAEFAALWAMTHEQRVDAMWAGRLTLSQLRKWTASRPQEIPLLGGEYAWIVMRTPEWDEPTEARQSSVIQLNRLGEHRAAA
jgi:hypothetical protein